MDTTLKIERIRAGFSQRQMSEELGIPLRTIENWDMGTRRPAPWIEKLIRDKLKSLGKERNTIKDKEHGVYTIREIKELTTSVFREHEVESAVLFGSYAKKTAHDKSDIDICVKTDLRGLKFYALLEDITEALNKDVDLIPEYQAERERDLFEEIKCTGVKIYDRKR
jgi:predicted nucleotidyltransferase/DNA-binding XRE family transcriptional regulator